MKISAKIKICGIKNVDEVLIINDLLVDYVGFVFAESKRQISINQALKLKGKLNSKIKIVGVFVDEPLEDIIDKLKVLDLDVIQLHGNESVDYIKKLKKIFKNIEIWKALQGESYNLKKQLDEYYLVDGILFDGKKPGSGKVFKWELIEKLNLNFKKILAGGLNSENVKIAIGKVRPDLVDVSSGVETLGVKDKVKIESFIRKVKK